MGVDDQVFKCKGVVLVEIPAVEQLDQPLHIINVVTREIGCHIQIDFTYSLDGIKLQCNQVGLSQMHDEIKHGNFFIQVERAGKIHLQIRVLDHEIAVKLPVIQVPVEGDVIINVAVEQPSRDHPVEITIDRLAVFLECSIDHAIERNLTQFWGLEKSGKVKSLCFQLTFVSYLVLRFR